MNSYIFIIPKTPIEYQDQTRIELYRLCINTLLNQTYPFWTALIVGISPQIEIKDDRLIIIPFEGKKVEKLHKATEFIIDNNIRGEYIIRLDDDDIINPTILERINLLNFDLFVDKYQWFWHWETGKISNRVWHWFANTCIHNRKHALRKWDMNSLELEINRPYLIENDHSKLHYYYKNKKVIFSKKMQPIYLRTITNSSITAKSSTNHTNYLKRFGNWRNNKLGDFEFLKKINYNNYKNLYILSKKERIINYYHQIKALIGYNKNTL
jgi:hypothetical protein